MKRHFDPESPEWMDMPQPVTMELKEDLSNLRTLNHRFGGVQAVLHPLQQRLTPGREWSLLDLATGSADIPRAISTWCREQAISLTIDAVDFQPSTLAVAAEYCRGHDDIRFHEADIRTFAPGRTWDIVTCSLALHHFSESDAVRILRKAAALSERYVIVSDLRRSWLGTWAVDLLTALWMRAPMTRNDARASVRRAFSYPEFAALARSANWPTFKHERVPTFRQTMIFEHPRNKPA